MSCRKWIAGVTLISLLVPVGIVWAGGPGVEDEEERALLAINQRLGTLGICDDGINIGKKCRVKLVDEIIDPIDWNLPSSSDSSPDCPGGTCSLLSFASDPFSLTINVTVDDQPLDAARTMTIEAIDAAGGLVVTTGDFAYLNELNSSYLTLAEYVCDHLTYGYGLDPDDICYTMHESLSGTLLFRGLVDNLIRQDLEPLSDPTSIPIVWSVDTIALDPLPPYFDPIYGAPLPPYPGEHCKADVLGSELEITVSVRSVRGGPEFIRGDANNNGKVTYADALYILSALDPVDPPIPMCLDAADVNNNGKVTYVDALHILSALDPAGLLLLAPYPERGRATEDVVEDGMGPGPRVLFADFGDGDNIGCLASPP